MILVTPSQLTVAGSNLLNASSKTKFLTYFTQLFVREKIFFGLGETVHKVYISPMSRA